VDPGILLKAEGQLFSAASAASDAWFTAEFGRTGSSGAAGAAPGPSALRARAPALAAPLGAARPSHSRSIR